MPDMSAVILALSTVNHAINSVDGTTSLIGEEYDGEDKWCGSVEAPDGSIYCSPHDASNFLKIDVRTGTTSLVGEVQQPTGGGGWDECESTTINGNIYLFMVPENAGRILMFDTTNDSVHEVGPEMNGDYNKPAISTFDGNAYAIPFCDSSSMLKINLSQLQTLQDDRKRKKRLLIRRAAKLDLLPNNSIVYFPI